MGFRIRKAMAYTIPLSWKIFLNSNKAQPRVSNTFCSLS